MTISGELDIVCVPGLREQFLGDPGASPRGHAPAGQLSTWPAGCAGPLRWAAAADNDDMREAVTALLAHADAWRDAELRRLLAPVPIGPPSADGSGERS